ncbi:hypothetical protein P6F26_18850 [Roseibacterium sp. SDUM158017]|uniref:hypothetical protein n=1 Tax=Roseicyclus salinarum TaxID=3036773 RepID=UPI0024158305|nr:hypothetical protein [Roseibacterium sp. SDUM158017]MDG4650508.1 hypothetical protein [Roseibacterium sp. SDUM158017]
MTERDIDLTPPEPVAQAAEKGLELCRKFDRGGTKAGVARARDLTNRVRLSENAINRMVTYFRRHELDRRGGNFGNDEDPSAGYVAWLLWGGDEGRDWAETMADRIERGAV